MGKVNYNKRVSMHILGTEKISKNEIYNEENEISLWKWEKRQLNVDYGGILGFQSGERAMSCILYTLVALWVSEAMKTLGENHFYSTVWKQGEQVSKNHSHGLQRIVELEMSSGLLSEVPSVWVAWAWTHLAPVGLSASGWLYKSFKNNGAHGNALGT